MSDQLPEIKVLFNNTYKTWRLYINGSEIHHPFTRWKDGIAAYLKRTYTIDLRTDTRIIKNYTEYSTKLVSNINGIKTYKKQKLW